MIVTRACGYLHFALWAKIQPLFLRSFSLGIPVVACLTVMNPSANPQAALMSSSSPYHNLETAAAALHQDHSQESVNALVNQTFAVPHRMALDDSAIALLKPMLASGEYAYWQGSSQGIREQDLVETINFLASKLNLPDYAHTSKKQLRELRMRLMLLSPRFMARGAMGPNISAISEYMSPMQAFHLTQTLVDQKFWQPEYQVTPAEWDQQTHEVTPPGATASTQKTPSVRLLNFPRSIELHQRMTAALNKLNDYDAVELATQALHKAGVL